MFIDFKKKQSHNLIPIVLPLHYKHIFLLNDCMLLFALIP